MQISLYEISGQTLRVGIRRRDDALPPLLLFNGIGANIELLEPFIDALDGHETITFDTGRGRLARARATLPSRSVGTAECPAARSAGTRAGRRAGRILGGALAQQFAFQHAKRCRRLVLAATSPGHLMVPAKPTALLKTASPRRYKDGEYMKRIAGDVYGGVLRRSPELVHRNLRHVRWSSDMGYYLQLIAVFGWSSLPWLLCLPQPTLVMAGTDDPLVPVANGHILAHLIPNARLVTIDDGHLFLVTSAGRSAALISDFLTQDPAHS